MIEEMAAWLQSFVRKSAFLDKYPCYAYILARLKPIADSTVDVMAVSAYGPQFYLHVNVECFLRNPQYLRGVLLHEVHHIVLGHLGHERFKSPAHPDLMNLAMEISANEYIQEPLPGEPVTWKDFQKLGIRSGQSTLERYEILVRGRLSGSVSPHWCPVDDHHRRGVGSTVSLPAEFDPSINERVLRIVEEAAEELNACGKAWHESAGLLAGTDPGRILERLRGTEDASEHYMDWRAAIQMFVSLIRTPTHTYFRPSRRFPSKVGQIPGRMHFPTRDGTQALLIVIDTSASMSREELAQIARQLIPLSDLVRITVVECDVVVQRVYEFNGILEDVAGRGGTDLRPVFEPDFLATYRPEGIIYFTDGCGPYPTEDPGVKTLWVLSKPFEFQCSWGERAYLPKDR